MTYHIVLPVNTRSEKTGRIYPYDEVDNAVFKANRLAATNRMYVDMNSDIVGVDLATITHKIEKFEIVGNNLIAHIEPLPESPAYHIFVGMDEAGVDTDFSACGTGVVDEDGIVSYFNLTKVSIIPGEH